MMNEIATQMFQFDLKSKDLIQMFYISLWRRFLYLYTKIEGEIAVRPFFTTVTNWLQQIPI